MVHDLLPGITIFTPTYNREHTLGRLYESIKKQACDQLEWLIVDDGSTDNTRELVQSFIREGKIAIRYVFKENGGKHTALNMGIQEAGREYFVCVDSDDLLTKEGLRKVKECVAQEQPDGIIAYKTRYGTGERIGKAFPDDLKKTTLLALINTYCCGGDRTLIYKTQHLQKIVIPEPEGQRFFPETYLYDRFDEQFECVLLRENICDCEYQTDGYSNSFRDLMINNAVSMKWFFAERIDMPVSRAVRFDAAYRYIAFSMMARSKQGAYQGKNKALLLAALPAGIAMFITYRRHRSSKK